MLAKNWQGLQKKIFCFLFFIAFSSNSKLSRAIYRATRKILYFSFLFPNIPMFMLDLANKPE
jgi:hypothetical protein